MPVICVFENENIKVYIYNFDHKKPHIHIVKKAKPQRKVWICYLMELFHTVMKD